MQCNSMQCLYAQLTGEDLSLFIYIYICIYIYKYIYIYNIYIYIYMQCNSMQGFYS